RVMTAKTSQMSPEDHGAEPVAAQRGTARLAGGPGETQWVTHGHEVGQVLAQRPTHVRQELVRVPVRVRRQVTVRMPEQAISANGKLIDDSHSNTLLLQRLGQWLDGCPPPEREWRATASPRWPPIHLAWSLDRVPQRDQQPAERQELVVHVHDRREVRGVAALHALELERHVVREREVVGEVVTGEAALQAPVTRVLPAELVPERLAVVLQIGRASCRERAWSAVVAGACRGEDESATA